MVTAMLMSVYEVLSGVAFCLIPSLFHPALQVPSQGASWLYVNASHPGTMMCFKNIFRSHLKFFNKILLSYMDSSSFLLNITKDFWIFKWMKYFLFPFSLIDTFYSSKTILKIHVLILYPPIQLKKINSRCFPFNCNILFLSLSLTGILSCYRILDGNGVSS